MDEKDPTGTQLVEGRRLVAVGCLAEDAADDVPEQRVVRRHVLEVEEPVERARRRLRYEQQVDDVRSVALRSAPPPLPRRINRHISAFYGRHVAIAGGHDVTMSPTRWNS